MEGGIKMAGPVSKNPWGPIRIRADLTTNSWMVSGPIKCGICGTEHPARENKDYVVGKFLGHLVVEECCGAIIDQVYLESGEEFAIAFLKEFAKNPTSPKFQIFLMELNKAAMQAQKTALEIAKQLHENHNFLDSINNIVKKRT